VSLAAWSTPPAFSQPARGETDVIVIGNRVFGTGAILALARDGGWKPEGGTAGLSVLQEAYFNEGYLQAAFEVGPVSIGSPDSAVALIVDEGDVARIGRGTVRGAKARSAESILHALRIRTSAEFVPKIFGRNVDQLLRSYDEQGYPFVQLWIDSLRVDAERNVVDIALFVVEGRERTLENVDVEGLVKTKSDLVVRMSGLETGRTYRGSMLRDAYLRLRSSGAFNEVTYPKLRISSDGAGVDAVIVVGETRRSNTFTGVLGYAAAEDSGDDQLSGLVQLRLNNIGGTLKDLHVFWANDGRGRSETRLRYRDRFFLGRLFTAGVSLEQVGQDTLYTWQSAGLEAGRPVGRIGRNLLTFTASVNADRNVFSEGPLLRSWRYRLAAGVSLVRGDPYRNTFVDAKTRVTVARKRSHYRDIDATDTAYQYILEFEGDGSVGFAGTLSLYTELVYRGLRSDEPAVPLSEQFYIGGARTLRGYRENQFRGPRVATTRTELRLGRTPEENLYLFLDTGYVLQTTVTGDAVIRDNQFKTGFGFGLRTRSQVGVVGLSFGVGEEVSLGRAKVHILLEQNF
jgi:outer membrane protein assembly factor BamA